MKKNIIVLGTGFAAFRFLKKINKDKYNVIVVSPRNHFLFTPLLPSTTVGTIEFRSIIEPIRNIKNIKFHQSFCKEINHTEKHIICKDSDTQKEYRLDYDILIIAVGEVSNTYNIEGVYQYAYFLKELSDARKIRTKIIDCFENASLPELSDEEKKSYLSFVVCGGGPTGVEFAAELNDFIEDVIKKRYKFLMNYVTITLIEGGETILATFDKQLREYTTKIFKRQKIKIRTNSYVEKVFDKYLVLKDGSRINYGLLVWATGNTSTELIKNSDFLLSVKNKIIVDEFFRVFKDKDKTLDDVFAIGDCSMLITGELPATAQVAQQQGLFLAKYLNRECDVSESFKYKNLGMLAYIGGYKALADTPQFKGTGFKTYILWRSAYLTKLVSLKNKILVLFDWTKTFFFGRDVSNF